MAANMIQCPASAVWLYMRCNIYGEKANKAALI